MKSDSKALAIALEHHQAGDLQRAEQIYRDITRANPQQPVALHFLGVIFHQRGQHQEAIDYIRRALQIKPDYVAALNNLGTALQALGRFAEAEAGYRSALRIEADNATAHNNLANALQARGKLAEAVANYRRALQINPQYAEAHSNLGSALHAQDRLDEAVENLRQALEIQPDYAEAHNNLGNALTDQRKLGPAAESYRRALRIKPEYALAHMNLGAVFQEQDKANEAKASYRRALEIEPERLLWKLRLATVCPAVFPGNEEIDRYRRELTAGVKLLAEKDLRIGLAELCGFASPPPLNTLFHGRDERPIREAYAGIFQDAFPQPKPGTRHGPPRIGFVVTGNGEDAFLRCTRGVLERFSPGLFELVILCSHAAADKISASIQSGAIQTRALPQRFERIVESVREARFDVLYYWQVGTGRVNYLLPFFRPAPVQVTSWGLPVTSGITHVDYYLSSELLEDRDTGGHYTERLLRLSGLMSYQQRACLPETPKTREDFALAPDRNVYLCAQRLGKFHPDFDRLLAGILRRDERGLIVAVEDRYGCVADKLRSRFAATIPDVSGRIVFLPRQAYPDYLGLIAAADVLLDTLHYGGAVTCYDGFSLNKPIVTWPSRFSRGRYTLACYRKMGITACIASDPDQYVDIAVALGTDADRRARQEELIRENSHQLFEDLEAVTEHERIFRELAREARSGKAS